MTQAKQAEEVSWMLEQIPLLVTEIATSHAACYMNKLAATPPNP